MNLRQQIRKISVSALNKRLALKPDYLKSVLTTREIKYCSAKRYFAEPAAARIAAKQAWLAFYKVSPGKCLRLMKDLEVIKTGTGKPKLKISPTLKRKFRLSKSDLFLISLAHERDQAIAWVVWVKTGEK